MKEFFLFFLAVITILVVINSSVAYKPVRSLKHYQRKPWVYRRPQWQRFSHPRKRPVNKRPPEFHYPPQRRPPRSQYLDRNREPFTIEFELPIEYVENYHGRLKGDFQNYDDDDYTLDDYGDDDADDRQLRVQVLKEGKKRLRIKLSRSDDFDTNKQSINGSNGSNY
ncbi:uncharacterized protein LOC123272448 [Cotesia glomerata]|uniref:uncharacterized protein LOC123272448 n=1 Tax=Cotesia glomerata TaxID=32391 RepID=UPI001D007387|nr:uncharacterized protein LOC123272448 [Cotesia glomerata]